MARGKKGQKKAESLINVVDLRKEEIVGAQKVVEMKEDKFKSLVKTGNLICYSYSTFEKVFEIETEQEQTASSPKAMFSDVWCPAIFGHHQACTINIEDLVYVDEITARYDPLISVLHNRKQEEEERTQKLVEVLLQEEQLEKEKSSKVKSKRGKHKQGALVQMASSSELKEAGGNIQQGFGLNEQEQQQQPSTEKLDKHKQGLKEQEELLYRMEKVDEHEHIPSAKRTIHEPHEQEVFFKDLRSGGATSTMPLTDFVEFVQDADVLCYNHMAYNKIYKVDNPFSVLQTELPPPKVWIPGRSLEDFLQRELVYVDGRGPMQGCLLEYLKEEQVDCVEKSDQFEGDGEEEAEDGWEDVDSKTTLKEIFVGFDGKLRDLSKSVKKLSKVVAGMQHSINEVNASVSRRTERTSRLTLAHVYERLHPGVMVSPPITNKILPYIPKGSLEALGRLCERPGQLSFHPTPLFAEIDILLKVKEGDEDSIVVSPELGQGGAETTTVDGESYEAYSHIVVGEVTRSVALCASWRQYKHPTILSNTSSTKLLYKFVQLERGIIACMAYYNISIHHIGGAAIISPSFMQLAEPRVLAAKVLDHCPTGLENVKVLYARHRLWLLDI